MLSKNPEEVQTAKAVSAALSSISKAMLAGRKTALLMHMSSKSPVEEIGGELRGCSPHRVQSVLCGSHAVGVSCFSCAGVLSCLDYSRSTRRFLNLSSWCFVCEKCRKADAELEARVAKKIFLEEDEIMDLSLIHI